VLDFKFHLISFVMGLCLCVYLVLRFTLICANMLSCIFFSCLCSMCLLDLL
jgi:hypothetical protein